MAVAYTQLLGHVSRESSGDVILYSTPPGIRPVVRDILLVNRTTVDAQFTVYWATGGGDILLTEVIVKQYEPYHLELRQVLLSDAVLHCFCAATIWTAAITGYELTEPAAAGNQAQVALDSSSPEWALA